jgi:hypothetical protein
MPWDEAEAQLKRSDQDASTIPQQRACLFIVKCNICQISLHNNRVHGPDTALDRAAGRHASVRADDTRSTQHCPYLSRTVAFLHGGGTNPVFGATGTSIGTAAMAQTSY